LRKRKLECVLQLGIEKEGMSFFSRLMISLLSFVLRISLHGRQTHVSQEAAAHDRTTIPAINLSECGEAYHFGGALRTDETLPGNYVAASTHVSSHRNNALAVRFLISYIECGGLSNYVVDFTYIIAGTEPDELPERAVGTVRLVSSAVKSCTLPIRFVTEDETAINKYPCTSSAPVDKRDSRSDVHLLCDILVIDPILAGLSAFTRSRPLRAALSAFFRSKHSVDESSHLPTVPRSASLGYSRQSRRMASIISSIDPFEEAVNELIQSLHTVTIPMRQLSSMEESVQARSVVHVPILQTLSRSDIRRYLIATDCSLKATAVRLVRSAAWRGLTFPIDTRMCRVELQSGQFFQQGRDLEGNPIFYFRNCCLGPWRKNEDATIAAVLHRLETSLKELQKDDSNVRCTLVTVMGRPCREKKKRKGEDIIDSVDDEQGGSDDDSSVETSNGNGVVAENNPRIPSEEKWHTHTSRKLLLRLIDILLAHYPERLSKALVVIGNGNNAYMRTTLRGKLALSVAVPSTSTRERVRFLTRYKDLLQFVDKEALVKLMGGNAPLSPAAFE
jgi:hypothetical protein